MSIRRSRRPASLPAWGRGPRCPRRPEPRKRHVPADKMHPASQPARARGVRHVATAIAVPRCAAMATPPVASARARASSPGCGGARSAGHPRRTRVGTPPHDRPGRPSEEHRRSRGRGSPTDDSDGLTTNAGRGLCSFPTRKNLEVEDGAPPSGLVEAVFGLAAPADGAAGRDGRCRKSAAGRDRRGHRQRVRGRRAGAPLRAHGALRVGPPLGVAAGENDNRGAVGTDLVQEDPDDRAVVVG